MHILAGQRSTLCKKKKKTVQQPRPLLSYGNFFSKYGFPVHCVSDNGPQFRSEEFAHFLKMNGVKHIRVAPYHAASNGLAARMVQSFKYQMKASKGGKLSMQQRIANFLLAYKSTTHFTTGRTPAGLFLGRELRTRLTLLCQVWAKRSWINNRSRRQYTTRTLVTGSG